MALTLDELRGLMESLDFQYFIDPRRPLLRSGGKGQHGSYDFVLALQDDGNFLQLRTLGYQSCAADHRNLGVALQVLADFNYSLRFLKFGWDSNDGEVVAYGDVWLADAKLSQPQFRAIFGNFVVGIDGCYPRITQAIQAGIDIGRKGESGGDIKEL
jgi:hypothetical protein